MDFFHCRVKVISRTSGRSSIASAAYRSGTKLVNERDGRVHDYSHRKDVFHSEIVLPEGAPSRWNDRSTLWNEVERTERSSRAQLAREVEYALPRELDPGQQVALARAVARSFATDGMVVDFAIHGVGSRNPHVHQLMTMRPCDANGFLPKSVNEYKVRDGEGGERYATAEELMDLGPTWEKVYRYRHIRGELTMSEAQVLCLDPKKGRRSKAPVQRTRYLTNWNERERVPEWRSRIATLTNEALAAAGSEPSVDHRSYESRGIERVPSVHEGPAVRKVEERARERALVEGRAYVPVSDVRRENVAIMTINDWFAGAARKIRRVAEELMRRAERSKRASAARRRGPERGRAHGSRAAITRHKTRTPGRDAGLGR